MLVRRFLLLLAVTALTSRPGFACFCAGSGTCAFNSNAEVIFLGTVVDQHTGDACHDGECSSENPQTTTFLVREPFRGVDAQKVELNTGAGICTYPFIVGQSYLVFANRYKGELYTDICTETRAEVIASALLQQLRAKGSGQQMASLFGSVLLAPKDAYERRGEVHYKPQSDVTVRIDDGKGNQFATTTDGEGAYSFRGLPVGEYELKVGSPAHTTTSNLVRNQPQRVKIDSSGACQQDIDPWWDGRIAGRVVDNQGRTVAGFVSLMWADMPSASLREKRAGLPGERVKADGSFELTLLSAGKYYLRFEHMEKGRFVRGPAYGYGPAITLQEGEHRDGILFIVPSLYQLPSQP